VPAPVEWGFAPPSPCPHDAVFGGRASILPCSVPEIRDASAAKLTTPIMTANNEQFYLRY